MCGRFVSSTPVAALAEQFRAEEVKAPEKDASFNVAPTDEVYAVATSRGARQLGTFRWGLVPSWAKDVSVGNRMINVRAESVSEKPSFQRILQRRRCVIPADGFYEWKAMGKGRKKQPFLIRARDGRALALAGLWEVWKDREDQDAEWLRSCTILTTEPDDLVAPLHDRMPAVLLPEAVDTWLDADVTDVGVLTALLRPYPSDLLEAWPVSTDVNSVENNRPDLVEPLEGHTGE
jgi:putative SOS response-associated peptidase YedK